MGKNKIKIVGTQERPRLVVFRSHKYIYGQLIDDENHQVIVAHSNAGKNKSKSAKETKPKVEISYEVGKALATLATKKKIKDVIFDRNGYLYHGRIKAFAEGAREGGLKF